MIADVNDEGVFHYHEPTVIADNVKLDAKSRYTWSFRTLFNTIVYSRYRSRASWLGILRDLSFIYVVANNFSRPVDR